MSNDADRQWRLVNKLYRLARLMDAPISRALKEASLGDPGKTDPLSVYTASDRALEVRLDARIRQWERS